MPTRAGLGERRARYEAGRDRHPRRPDRGAARPWRAGGAALVRRGVIIALAGEMPIAAAMLETSPTGERRPAPPPWVCRCRRTRPRVPSVVPSWRRHRPRVASRLPDG